MLFMLFQAIAWFGAIFLFLWLLVIIFILFSTIFWVMMLIDCVQRDFEDKLIWVLIILLVGSLGAFIYYFIVKKKSPPIKTKK